MKRRRKMSRRQAQQRWMPILVAGAKTSLARAPLRTASSSYIRTTMTSAAAAFRNYATTTTTTTMTTTPLGGTGAARILHQAHQRNAFGGRYYWRGLSSFVATPGMVVSPSTTPAKCGVPLWWSTRRGLNMNGTLSYSQHALPLSFQIASLSTTATGAVPNLSRKYWEDVWEAKFELLQQYQKEHGDCLVKHDYTTTDGIKLGAWVSKQRQQYKTLQEGKPSAMTQERIEKLESIGFILVANGSLETRWTEKWNAHFELLSQYAKEHGDCLVKHDYTTTDGFKLGRWVNTQRQQYKKFQKDQSKPMTQERIEKLESIGFVWDAKKVLESQWNETWNAHLDQLSQYAEEHGDCLVPMKYTTTNGFKLGKWVSRQRDMYRNLQEGRSSAMAQERMEKLESIGFVWDTR